jgi:hypothetical protein
MKDKSEIKIEGKPVFYAILYNSMRQAALDCGYALALHGSMHSDMDLMAMAWTEDAKSEEELIKVIDNCIGETIWKQCNFKWERIEKPHGRVSYIISIIGGWFIDLSIMPPKNIINNIPDRVTFPPSDLKNINL